MPRDIKFRAWDKDNKEMIYQSENTTKSNGIMEAQFSFDEMGAYIFTINYEEKAWKEVKHFELMQYTGLQDKNGKEIYEGDILDCSYINPMSKENVKRLFEVMFEKGTFKAKCIGHSPYGDTLLYFENEKGIVIGNIYENPELLK